MLQYNYDTINRWKRTFSNNKRRIFSNFYLKHWSSRRIFQIDCNIICKWEYSQSINTKGEYSPMIEKIKLSGDYSPMIAIILSTKITIQKRICSNCHYYKPYKNKKSEKVIFGTIVEVDQCQGQIFICAKKKDQRKIFSNYC